MIMKTGYVSAENMSRLLGKVPNPLKTRINQIKGGDFNWFSNDFTSLFPDVTNDKFSTINDRMREVAKDLTNNKTLEGTGEEPCIEKLNTDITRVATNSGFFGKNIKLADKNKALVDNPNGKIIASFIIDEFNKAFQAGEADLNEKDLLGMSFSSNMGHNPEGFHPWSTKASDKIDFINNICETYKMDHTLENDRFIVQAYRKTFDKADKARPNFLLDRTTGKLYEGLYTAIGQPMRPRSIASVPWYDNFNLMYVNQVLMIGKNDNAFLKSHIGFTTNTMEQAINATGLEAFATDVASADYTHKLEDLRFFFENFLDGKLMKVFKGLFENMNIAGAYLDDDYKEKYYVQENLGRFLSGTGLTYWLNVFKYLSCQIANLISYDRHKNGGKLIWENNSAVVTADEIRKVKCLNKGDDALDFIKKGDSNLYENIIKLNIFIQAEKEPFTSFDGYRIEGKPSYYYLRGKYQTYLLNTIEKREIRKPENPMNRMFYNGLSGKIDLLDLRPTVDYELGLEMLRLTHYMITGNVKFDKDLIKKRAIEESHYLVNNERMLYIDKAVAFLGLRNINALNYEVSARDIGSLPLEILDNLFITKKMLEIKPFFEKLK